MEAKHSELLRLVVVTRTTEQINRTCLIGRCRPVRYTVLTSVIKQFKEEFIIESTFYVKYVFCAMGLIFIDNIQMSFMQKLQQQGLVIYPH
jgi:uncharacterized Fe-S radical SAM superfamily protein PflX